METKSSSCFWPELLVFSLTLSFYFESSRFFSVPSNSVLLCVYSSVSRVFSPQNTELYSAVFMISMLRPLWFGSIFHVVWPMLRFVLFSQVMLLDLKFLLKSNRLHCFFVAILRPFAHGRAEAIDDTLPIHPSLGCCFCSSPGVALLLELRLCASPPAVARPAYCLFPCGFQVTAWLWCAVHWLP